MKKIAGIDIGTTNVKITVYNECGEELAQSSGNYRNCSLHSISALSIWDAVLSCVSAVSGQLTAFGGIDALAVSSFGESIVPVDEKGNPLSDIVLRTAANGEEELEEILGLIPAEEITGITGLFPDKRFSLIKMKYYKSHSDVYDRAYKFLTIDSYIIFMLTGGYFTSESTAWRTMAYDIHSSAWSGKLLEAAQLNPDKLPEVLPAGSFCGLCKKPLADSCKLLSGTKVYIGGHDQLCNAVGSGLMGNDLLNCSGTVECISSVIAPIEKEEKISIKLQQTEYPADKGKCFSFWAPVSGCSSLDWCLNFLWPDQFTKEKRNELHKKIQGFCYGRPTSLYCAPYFNGRGFPDLDSTMKGMVEGFTFGTTSVDFYQSVMESIAFEDKICVEKFLPYKAGGQEINILVSGGGTNSEYWMQMKANIFERNVVKLCHRESGTMGAMIFAAIGEGYYDSFDAAFRNCIRVKEIYRPDKRISEMYHEKYLNYLSFRRRFYEPFSH